MSINDRIEQWKQAPFDQATIAAVKDLEAQPKEIEDAFYTEIAFGTGGMRGVMGPGTNRVNKYTLGKASQGVANYLKKTHASKTPKIVIAYDCRNNSSSFAQAVADVFTANNIDTYVFSRLRPTPLLSFAVRHLNADAGIVLTASHNPPEYNGYKVYNQYGGQIVPPEDGAIMEEINALNFNDIKWDAKDEHHFPIDEAIDQAYTQTIVGESFLSPKERENTKIVFTALHGTSIMSLPAVLKSAGYEQVHIVEEQSEPDGNFPTVESPNPEEAEAFTLALQLAKAKDADIVLGTDPDADRIGIGVKDSRGNWQLLNGNQLMVALTRFVLEQEKDLNNSFIASTVVSTPLMSKIATAYGVECKLGLTGFKWIGKMIQDFPNEKFLCGGEESYGFLYGKNVRDKDAISAALLACDLQAHLNNKGSSIEEYLKDTYRRYGFFHEELISITKKGKQGAEEIAALMENLRNNPPKSLGGIAVESLDDFESAISIKADGTTTPLDFPKANVLRFTLIDGSTIAVRPSGTEPKIKYYFSVNQPLEKDEDFTSTQKVLKEKCINLKNAVAKL